MATVASARMSPQPPICDKCGDAPVAPDFAEYFSEAGLILYLWSCARCGNRFATEGPAAVGPEAEQEAVKAFWPSLLVG
jgi:hypothetical protein